MNSGERLRHFQKGKLFQLFRLLDLLEFSLLTD